MLLSNINAPRLEAYNFFYDKDDTGFFSFYATLNECVAGALKNRNEKLKRVWTLTDDQRAVYEFCKELGVSPKQAYRIALTSYGLCTKRYVAMQDYGWCEEDAWRWNDKVYSYQYIDFHQWYGDDYYGIRERLNHLSERKMRNEFYADYMANPPQEGRVYLERQVRDYFGGF